MQDSVHFMDEEIKDQRKQIRTFASEIEVLKKQVGDLSKFGDRIRIIADIDPLDNSGGFIGIGGSIPTESLDTDIPSDSKYNSLTREMHQQVDQVKTVISKRTDDFESLIGKLEQKRNYLSAIPSIKPVDGWLTSGFGKRRSPFTGGADFHTGIDIANASGTEIIATGNGRVSKAGSKRIIGKRVAIDHGYGYVTQYGHMKKILVNVGQKVKRGDVIGLVGKTGRTTGPHLHYEVLVNGTPVNPMKYILDSKF
jgi:murein DD-endopeptidase MepM/ murein hydrolase activator NlpD